MPDEIYNELIEYLNERDKKLKQIQGDRDDIKSTLLTSENDHIGQDFRPKMMDELENELVEDQM